MRGLFKAAALCDSLAPVFRVATQDQRGPIFNARVYLEGSVGPRPHLFSPGGLDSQGRPDGALWRFHSGQWHELGGNDSGAQNGPSIRARGGDCHSGLQATLGAASWFFGATLIEQVDDLRQKIPDGAEWIRRQIEARSYMRDALSNLDVADLSGPTGWLARTLAPKVTSLLATAGSLVVMAIVAVYFAAQPERYRSGLLLLAPPASRDRAAQLFEAISRILARWLLGQLVVMAAVGLMSGLGLWLLGVRAAFILGLLGGLLSFIPFFGSVLTAALAALFALGQGPSYALAVIAMYLAVHFIEG